MNTNISILDCTLRDGSYVVHQQLTAEDTFRICVALEQAGIEKIEVGHGVGLGASGPRHGVSAATDEEYIAAAAAALKKAKFGTFYIPGIGTPDHLKMARDHGMQFVRIGSNIRDYQSCQSHIECARKLGLEVSYNAMKSHTAEPKSLLEVFRQVILWGAQAIYVVDSTGTFTPADVRRYVKPLVGELEAPVGLHAHNNLMLANANCIAAWEAGATLFDGTMQGVGRSGGNAQTEIIAYVFEKMGIPTGIDVRSLLDSGERLVRPWMGSEGGATSINVIIGMAGFHSTYFHRVNEYAKKYEVNVYDLILAVSRKDQIDPSDTLIEEVALSLGNI